MQLSLLLRVYAQQPSYLPYQEPHRPRFHFSSTHNWINDPNGLVFHNGEYHLFYQHNPYGNEWGHMSWGHAVSKDLVYWEHLPLAIPEDNGVMIFSGCVVVDYNNSSGFAGNSGKIPMVAVYTGFEEGKNQSQRLAYSLDNGKTWTQYGGNPVLDRNKKDFRDPKVFWYEPHRKWVMVVVLATEKKIQFYSSVNLKDWKWMSDFGPAGDTTGIWECPDLFKVKATDNRDMEKWVLMHSPAPYMQYFIGEFDGTRFVPDQPVAPILRPDYGSDYYAAIVYNNLPADSDAISIGWVNNWNYANALPTTPWKGAMSIPRILRAKIRNGQWRLVSFPWPGLQTLRGQAISWTNSHPGRSALVPSLTDQWELKITWTPPVSGLSGIKAGTCAGKEILIAYDPSNKNIVIRRGDTAIFSHPAFKQMTSLAETVSLSNKQLTLHILHDHSITEIFVNEGESVLTFQSFSKASGSCVEIFSESGNMVVETLDAWPIKTIWPD
jgi:fructan beta-fructosidase